MSNYKRVKIDQWWELHVKGGSDDGKSFGPVCNINKVPIHYSRKNAHNIKASNFRKGFAKVVKVTRYRIVKK
jgi:hypothetical protein